MKTEAGSDVISQRRCLHSLWPVPLEGGIQPLRVLPHQELEPWRTVEGNCWIKQGIQTEGAWASSEVHG